MTLIKWKNDPGKLIDSYPTFPAFDDFFGDFFNGVMSENAMRSVPAVNIAEQNDKFSIELAAPGFTKGDFKVEMENGVLTISAEKKEEKTDANTRYTRKEFAYSSFKRSFSLPDHVEGDKIGAAYNDGLLTLTLPKREEAKQKPAKEITID